MMHLQEMKISRSTSTFIFKVLAWFTTLLIASSYIGTAEAVLGCPGYPFSRRCFEELHCNGTYDKSRFASLDRVCTDCYNLFDDHRVYNGCRTNCFRHEYFDACLVSLLLTDDKEKFQKMIDYLAGK